MKITDTSKPKQTQDIIYTSKKQSASYVHMKERKVRQAEGTDKANNADGAHSDGLTVDSERKEAS